MIFGKLNKTKEELKVYFDDKKSVGVSFSRSTIIYMRGAKQEYEFHMRFFYNDGTNKINFGSQDQWAFVARKDFLVRKSEVEKTIIRLLHYEKEFVLNKLFEV